MNLDLLLHILSLKRNSEKFGNFQKNSEKFRKIQKNSEKFGKIGYTELAKSIGIGIGFLSCIGIGIGIAKTIFKVLVLLSGFSKYWYWYC